MHTALLFPCTSIIQSHKDSNVYITQNNIVQKKDFMFENKTKSEVQLHKHKQIK